MALAERAAVELTRRFHLRLEPIRVAAGAAGARTWAGLGSYDRKDVDRYKLEMAAATALMVATGLRLAAAYYGLLGLTAAVAVGPEDVAVEAGSEGPFLAYWHALKEQRPWDEAWTAGQSTAQAEGEAVVTSATRKAGDVVAERSGQRVVGWRRVLSGSSCEWCVLVSTQRYYSAESADFGHERCNCGAVPIFGDSDPGRVINREVLDRLNATDKGDRTGYVDDQGNPTARPESGADVGPLSRPADGGHTLPRP